MGENKSPARNQRKSVFLKKQKDADIFVYLRVLSSDLSAKKDNLQGHKKKLKFAATGLRKEELQIRDLMRVRDFLASEKLKTVIDRVYPLEKIQEAHSYVDSGRKKGNVIVIP